MIFNPRRSYLLLALILFAACGKKGGGSDDAVKAFDREAILEGNIGFACMDDDVESRVASLLSQMTLEEKVLQMHGDRMEDVTYALGVERLGIPGMVLTDGPRGAKPSPATTFPVGICRGATWNTALEKKVGEVMGAETRAKGADVLLAPTLEPVRHPRWGRTQETFGEDPFLVARMGVAFISGVQNHVMASAKHYAANNIEDTRFTVSANMDERTLREIYLPPFKSAVMEAGSATVMSAYNRVNGDYCGENEHLLRDILKGEWGFKGFVESDWLVGTRSTVKAANNGLDAEMPGANYFGDALVAAVNDGEVSMEVIDEAVGRILRQKFCFGLDRNPVADPSIVESADHVAVALQSAREGIVLLKNQGGLLPLNKETTGSIVLAGSLADFTNLGDYGSSSLAPTVTTTIKDGLVAAHPGTLFLDTDTLSGEEETAMGDADAVVIVVGNFWRDEGENMPIVDPETGLYTEDSGDRKSLNLKPEHEALIKKAASLNDRVIVVLIGSGAFFMDGWLEDVEGLLMAWYPGMRGGQAVAEVLFGEVNPSGKLPMTFPKSDAQLPVFDNTSTEVEFDMWHGYRLADREGYQPNFPFGFGLSYTTFEYSNLRLSTDAIKAGETVEVRVDLTNTGDRAGDEVVQLYVSYEGSAVERAVKELKGFGRLSLNPGETKTLLMEVKAEDLAYYNMEAGAWTVEPLTATLKVGPSSANLPLGAELEVR